jgi:DNA-directed RNA polymerase specialized sigma24 family protein
MREVWEIVKTHRDHKDYSHRMSHVKMDFHRQYYHTRADTKVEPIIGAYGENGEEEIIHAPYMPNEYAEVETRIWFGGFLELLNDKDRQIVKLLEEGYTQEEIGKILGYSNHSGVNKRIKYIRAVFEDFQKDDIELLKYQHTLGKRNKIKTTK